MMQSNAGFVMNWTMYICYPGGCRKLWCRFAIDATAIAQVT